LTELTIEDQFQRAAFQVALGDCSTEQLKTIATEYFYVNLDLQKQVKILFAEKIGMPQDAISQYIGRDPAIDAISLMWRLANDPELATDARDRIRLFLMGGGAG